MSSRCRLHTCIVTLRSPGPETIVCGSYKELIIPSGNRTRHIAIISSIICTLCVGNHELVFECGTKILWPVTISCCLVGVMWAWREWWASVLSCAPRGVGGARRECHARGGECAARPVPAARRCKQTKRRHARPRRPPPPVVRRLSTKLYNMPLHMSSYSLRPHWLYEISDK